MTIDDRSRHDLHTALERALGAPADTLMAMLPPAGWSEIATTRDLDRHQAVTQRQLSEVRLELKTEMADLKTELKTEMADLRTEMAGLRTELKIEMAGLRTELKTEMADVRTHFTNELAANMRTMVLVNAGTIFTGVGLAFTAARFG